ncbi:MAG TPA: hypothetical protein VHO06_24780, partial [Polyangia bacterium]|nr:hypothetical protein [Polyangia bacterium]
GSRASWATAAVAVERPAFRRRIGLRLSAGAETSVAVDFATGSAEVRQLPVRMGAYLPIALSLGRLEPGVGLDLDVVSVDFTRKAGTGSNAENHLGASPGIDAALAWALMLPHGIYLRALADAVTSVPYQVVTASNDTRIFNTPRFTLSLGLELGLWFR